MAVADAGTASSPEPGADAFPAAPLRVRACTWNLSGNQVAQQDDFGALLLGDALLPRTPSSSSAAAGTPRRRPPPDICVVALQETVELNVGNIFWATEEEEISAHSAFEERVVKELQRSGQRYMKVGSVGMVGLLLMVYVRGELADKVREVDCDRVKTGVFHMAGNKGAVCVRFELSGVSFCFLDVHLHAGQESQAARNQDIQDIFSFAFQACGAYGSSRAQKNNYGRASEFAVSSHNVTVMLGDFNFRLDLPEDEPLPDGPPSTWLQYDQLRRGCVEGLEDFVEGEIEFGPTYKYLIGTDMFDSKRHPAWCDRVLYKAASLDTAIRLKRYDCLSQLRNTSDHWPVIAELEVRDVRWHSLLKGSLASTGSLRTWLLHKSLSLLGGGAEEPPLDAPSAASAGHGLGSWTGGLMGGCCCGGTELVSAVRRLRSCSSHSVHHVSPQRSLTPPALTPEFSGSPNGVTEAAGRRAEPAEVGSA